MSQGLTWEILSHLAAADASDPDRSPPFYAQRQDTFATEHEPENHRLKLFFMACPIYESRSASSQSTSRAVFSLERIQKEFMHVLQMYSNERGKLAPSEIGMWLGMDERDVKYVGDFLCENSNAHTDSQVIHFSDVRGESYALKCSMLQQLSQTISLYCHGSNSHESMSTALHPSLNDTARQTINIGTVTVQQLARDMVVSVEDVTRLLQELLREKEHFTHDALQSLEVVIDEKTGCIVEIRNKKLWQEYLERQVISALIGVTTPVSIDSLLSECNCQENQSTIQSIVQSLCDTNKINGTLYHSTFTPSIHSTTQRKSVDSFFRANGFLSEKRCIGFGLSKNRMEDFVKESFPNARSLKCSIIDIKQLCLPLEDAIRSSIINESFVDLKSILPDDVTSCEEDLQMIVKDVFDDLLMTRDDKLHGEYSRGVSVVISGIALFFSEAMVERAKKLMPPLIEDYGKQKANGAMKHQDLSTKIAASKKHSQQQSDDGTSESSTIIPLVDVAKRIAQSFSELSDIQQHYELSHNQSSLLETNKLSWNPYESSADGPLIEFCRHALDYNALHAMCLRAIKAETIAIQHKVNAISHVEGAARTQNREEAFEASFRDMCYLIQLFAKGIHSIEGRIHVEDSARSESEIINEMKDELLMSCGTCLSKRITEYCLFKHAVPEEQSEALIFECCMTGLPHREHGFCIPVDMGSLAFPVISLKCNPDESGKEREAVTYLKTLFSPHVGLNLVKMWNLCSHEKTKDAEEQHNLEAFIHHLNEMCLSLVGVPFAVLDKKNEKRVLASRRQCIIDLLECTSNKEQALLSATVLIFQLAKNASIVGKLSTTLVLNMFFPSEKKIPRTVADTLLKLESEAEDEDGLMSAVKKYGQTKSTKALSLVTNDA